LILGVILYASFAFCAGIDNLNGYYAAFDDAMYYSQEGMIDSADAKIGMMRSFLKEGKYSEDTDEYGNYYYVIAVREGFAGNKDVADEYFTKAADVFGKNYGEGSETMFHVYRNTGKALVNAKLFDLALGYLAKSEEAFKQSKLENDINWAELALLTAKAHYSAKTPNYERAREYADEAISSYDGQGDYSSDYCYAVELAGDACAQMKLYKEAKGYYDDALIAYADYFGADDYKIEEITEKLNKIEGK